MNLFGRHTARPVSFAFALQFAALVSCSTSPEEVQGDALPDVGASVVADVLPLQAAASSTDTGMTGASDAGSGTSGSLPTPLESGLMTVGFTGEYDAATRQFSFTFEDSRVESSALGGLRTSSQALWCSSRLRVVRDGVPGSNPPDSFELETVGVGTYAECDPGTYPDGSPSLVSYADLVNTDGALCASVTIRSFYSSPFDDVYAWIYEVNPVDNYAYTWGDRFLDGLGNGSEPPLGDNAPSDNRGGLFYYGDLAARGPAVPTVDTERTVSWVFRYPIDGANFNFRGLLVARFVETCNGLDDDCDGSVDEGPACEGQPCCFGGQCQGVCNSAVIDATGACAAPVGFGTDVCDGLDNDCDGSLDEGDTRVGALCPTGSLGVCGQGTGTCEAGSFSCRGGATPSPETCDGADNNCDGETDEGVTSTWYRDADGDGAGRSESGVVVACSAPLGYVDNDTDCNDQLAAFRPGAEELIGDEVDQNCDGAELCFADSDDDGFRTSDTVVSTNVSCSDAGEALPSEPATDCDDTRAAVNPAATEVCNGLDDNCDGATDDTGLTTYYRDLDGDGFGDVAGGTTEACGAPAGYSEFDTDCDDATAAVNPGATEIPGDELDQNCDGAELCFADADDDGFRTTGTVASTNLVCSDIGEAASSTPAGDCDDAQAAVNPAASESCNGVDDDCNGTIDDGGFFTFYRDADGDGFGSSASGTTAACSAPAGFVSSNSDCNDSNSSIRPGATEAAGDEVDQNCDGAELCFVDADNDGFRLTSTVSSANVSCGDSGEARSSEPTGDCSDSNATINPGAAELCNGVDDNCNGTADEGVQTTFFRDVDGDTFGSAASGTSQACFAPVGFVVNSTDCNDGSAATFPGAPEVPGDEVDQSCDGGEVCFVDADNDGFRLTSTVVSSNVTCGDSGEARSSEPGGDCNDGNAAVNPGATEVCNTIDDDCDGSIDEGGLSTFFRDADGDGFGAAAGGTLQACGVPAGYSASNNDCNDSSASIRPGGTEVCNGADDDCDASIDEGVQSTFFRDVDGDGAGAAGSGTTLACTAPSGFVSANNDCNDGSAAIRPGATEVAGDEVDQNCDGTELCFVDADNDGYRLTSTVSSANASCGDSGEARSSEPTGDCNDGNAAVNPGATEVCNGVDDNCVGGIDDGVGSTFFRDADGDGFGSAASGTTVACSAPGGFVSNSSDCNDSSSSIRPGATEVAGDEVDQNCDGAELCFVDADNDGFRLTSTVSSANVSCGDSGEARSSEPTGDCSDSNATINPGAAELCNGVDDNCNGTADEGVQTTFFRDVDGDGFGSSASGTTAACSAPGGFVSNNSDCNDSSASVRPGGTEACNGVDDDCDGAIDEGVQSTFFRDVDGDGFGASASGTTTACSAPSGFVNNSSDCNDGNGAVYPGAPEVPGDEVDQSCDGGEICFVDADNDGFRLTSTVSSANVSCGDSGEARSSEPTGDCNDGNASIRPGATEVCNGIDDNCAGGIDEGVQSTFFRDVDGDGFGSSASGTTAACSAPGGFVSNNSDCNDSSASVRPGGTEACNGVDDDCDGSIDEGVQSTFFRDVDGDGFGSSASGTTAACSAPGGFVSNNSDCNDGNGSIRPGGTEVCNGADDNCNGSIDEGVGSTFFRDADNDGFGSSASGTTVACTAPGGFVSNNSDCNDGNGSIRPGGTEVCNGVDDDCDGSIDEGVQTTFFRDADNDGFGSSASGTTAACTAPGGFVSNNSDCNDGNSSIRPGGTEVCNGADDNCNGSIDEGVQSTFFRDADGDGFGSSSSGTTAACSAPGGFVSNNSDCNDGNSSIRPGGTEVCNGADDNCNGSIDEGVQSTFFRDADNDGFGSSASGTTVACTAPGGFVSNNSDCNDSNGNINPGRPEACNGIDDNCDGLIDNGVPNAGVLDDTCDNVDDDCDGSIDEDYMEIGGFCCLECFGCTGFGCGLGFYYADQTRSSCINGVVSCQPMDGAICNALAPCEIRGF